MSQKRAVTEKRCSRCREVKVRDHFYVTKGGYLSARCIPCVKVTAKEWTDANREKARASTKAAMLRLVERDPGYVQRANRRAGLKKYGLTQESYDEILRRQGGVCGICGVARTDAGASRLAVDHDHESGQVRGLLCRRCNSVLGLIECMGLQHDITERITAYLGHPGLLTQNFGG